GGRSSSATCSPPPRCSRTFARGIPASAPAYVRSGLSSTGRTSRTKGDRGRATAAPRDRSGQPIRGREGTPQGGRHANEHVGDGAGPRSGRPLTGRRSLHLPQRDRHDRREELQGAEEEHVPAVRGLRAGERLLYRDGHRCCLRRERRPRDGTRPGAHPPGRPCRSDVPRAARSAHRHQPVASTGRRCAAERGLGLPDDVQRVPAAVTGRGAALRGAGAALRALQARHPDADLALPLTGQPRRRRTSVEPCRCMSKRPRKLMPSNDTGRVSLSTTIASTSPTVTSPTRTAPSDTRHPCASPLAVWTFVILPRLWSRPIRVASARDNVVKVAPVSTMKRTGRPLTVPLERNCPRASAESVT